MKFTIFPSDTHSIDLLNALLANNISAADHLSSMAPSKEGDPSFDKLIRSTQLDQEKLTDALCKSFLVPFNRQDIFDLSIFLYKGVVGIDKIRRRFNTHQLVPFQNDFPILYQLLAQHVSSLSIVFKWLIERNIDGLRTECLRLISMEKEMDFIQVQLLANTPSGPVNSDFLLRKDVYTLFNELTLLYRTCGEFAFKMALKWL